MEGEPIVFVGTSDLSARFRGKSFPAADLPSRLRRGVGLAPTNLFLSAFGPIQVTIFGTVGEVFLIPDASTRVLLPFDAHAPEHFFVGDIKTLEGTPWEFCPRQILRRAIERLQRETGLDLLASFEQEFVLSGVPATPWQPYSLDAYRRQGAFGEILLRSLRLGGVVPDSFLSEYGPRQYEVTCAPARGLRSADDAVITREIVQAVAFRLDQRVSLAPIPDPDGIGNGTHIHWSFRDEDDRPVLYEERCRWQLSTLGSQFVAGIQHHLPALCAISAASVPSYYRLRPNRWAPVRADVGALDRGAAVRICQSGGDPAQRAAQFNVEFRVADATGNPYLALAMLVQAGLEGIRRRREIELEHPPALPASLSDALTQLEQDDSAAEWLGSEMLRAYLLFKRAEIQGLEGLAESEICSRYMDAY